MSEQQQQQPTTDALSRYARLTDREREITIGFANRQRSRDLAEKYGISVKTIDSHRQNILRKLELDGNPDLVHDAIVNGMVPVSGEYLPSLLAVANAARAVANGTPAALEALRSAVADLDSRKLG